MADKPKPADPNTVGGDFVPVKESGLNAFRDETNKRFVDIERLTKAILFVAMLTLMGIFVAVVTLVMDQMHFNNQTYIQKADDSQSEIRLMQEQNAILRGKNE